MTPDELRRRIADIESSLADLPAAEDLPNDVAEAATNAGSTLDRLRRELDLVRFRRELERVTDSSVTDALAIDISEDMRRVDRAAQQILDDRRVYDEFIENPIGCLARLRVVPRTDQRSTDRANRIFYATLANKKLVQTILDEFDSFESRPEATEFFERGLEDGELRNLPLHDLEAADHVLRHPDHLRAILDASLKDLNERRLLPQQYLDNEIDNFIEEVVEAARNRRPVREFPRLPSPPGTDPDIDPIAPYAGVAAVAVVALAAVAAEVVVAFTVAVAHTGPPAPERLNPSVIGDLRRLRKVSMLSRLTSLASDLAFQAHLSDRP